MRMNFIKSDDNAFVSPAKIGAFKGAVKDLKNSDYHSLTKYWSSTQLKYMYESSPRHFEEEYIKPKQKDEPSDSMVLGSVLHTILLTPNDFEKEFFIMPDLNFRTNEGKAAREEHRAKNQGKMEISDKLLQKAQLMRIAIEANPQARKLLEPGLKEASYFWQCPFSELPMKAKLDQSSSLHFTELKTTREVGADNFARQAYNFNYDLSLFHYREGMRQILDLEVPAYFIAVESEPPHNVQCYKAPDWIWMTGRDKWLTAVQRLETAIKSKKWQGYFPEDGDIPDLPEVPWATKKHEVV